jgi:Tol biopolymer transport system component
MALAAGTHLGPYEILSAIGAGGMGEVYRAHDMKLNRDVALKILPDAFVSDPDRLARFMREAQTLAALNDPHIAHLHGLEESDGVRALVMELVEGEDLAERIARGPMPLDEALPIARQIAEALEAAHGQGIIHRDLKPANIKVRRDGVVKVLDFGLAKAMAPLSSSSAAAVLDNAPTITSPAAMTAAGIILGTAAYMSPEQARGRAVDKRADIWAFGCLLYEMLAGIRPFGGDDVTDTIAAVVRADPDWSKLPPDTPAAIRRLLRRCLEKDRTRRLPDAADARLEIDDALSPLAADAKIEHPAPPTSHGTLIAGWHRAVPWAGAAALGVALMLVLWAPWRKTVQPPAPVRVTVELGVDGSLSNADVGNVATLSPDGAVLAFVAQHGPGGSPQLYVRRLTQLQAVPLSGTDGAGDPFFSPDGQWIAFFTGDKLKKIAVTGGAAVTLCDAPNSRGGAWGEDSTIVFATRATSLQRVSSGAGTPAPLTSLAGGEVSQRWPQVLPGGQSVLYTAITSTTTTGYNDANLVVQTLPAGARKVVQRGGYHGRYLPSGHLVYLHDGTLFAAPFDLDRLEITDQPVPAVTGVTSNEGTGGGQFAVSAAGTLVYLPGETNAGGIPIHWTDHEGITTPLRVTQASWFNLRFASDGRRLAMDITQGPPDIWIYEWARDTLTRLTSDPGGARKPVCTPDSSRIVFASGRADSRADRSALNLFWQRADGSGEAQRLTESKNPQLPASWHPSGKFLAFEEQTPRTSSDLMILPMEGDDRSGWKPGTPTVFLDSPFAEREPMFSPDGRWLAYSSNETGRNEVYVRPFPGPGGKWRISTSGGIFPTWSRTRPELFYSSLDQRIMVAPYAVEGDSFRAEKPGLWSDIRYSDRGPNRMFDLHPDGERFAFAPVTEAPAAKQDHLTFVFNFFDELRRIAPATRR